MKRLWNWFKWETAPIWDRPHGLGPRLYQLRHPPEWISWVPPWRRHKSRCNDRLKEDLDQLMAGEKPAPELQAKLWAQSYCPGCDYWELKSNNPVFWLVLLFGEA